VTGARDGRTLGTMRYESSDLVRKTELDRRATGAIAWALSQDSWLTSDAEGNFRERGFGHLAHLQTKAAVSPLASSHEALAGGGALEAALTGVIDSQSLVGALTAAGALTVPLDPSGPKLFVGTVTGHTVAEAASKPISSLDFTVTGRPTKAAATVVVTAEAGRSIAGSVQDAIRGRLVQAAAREIDAVVVAALTGGTPAASSDPGVLLAAVTGGQPLRPMLIGGFAELLAIDGSTLRALRDLGVVIIQSPAAAGQLVALDAAGILIRDGGVVVQTSRSATLAMDDGGAGTANYSLFQRNAIGLRAERWLAIDLATDAVAFAVGSP